MSNGISTYVWVKPYCPPIIKNSKTKTAITVLSITDIVCTPNYYNSTHTWLLTCCWILCVVCVLSLGIRLVLKTKNVDRNLSSNAHGSFFLSVIANTKIAFLVRGLAFIGRLLMGRKTYAAWTLCQKMALNAIWQKLWVRERKCHWAVGRSNIISLQWGLNEKENTP